MKARPNIERVKSFPYERKALTPLRVGKGPFPAGNACSQVFGSVVLDMVSQALI